MCIVNIIELNMGQHWTLQYTDRLVSQIFWLSLFTQLHLEIFFLTLFPLNEVKCIFLILLIFVIEKVEVQTHPHLHSVLSNSLPTPSHHHFSKLHVVSLFIVLTTESPQHYLYVNVCKTIYWSMGSLSGATTLKKTDSPFL